MNFSPGLLTRPFRYHSRPCCEPLEVRRLLAGRGFVGYYFEGTDFTSRSFTREDPVIQFNWANDAPVESGASGFGVRWSARVVPKFSEPYHLYLRTTGSARLWIAGELVVTATGNGTLRDYKGTINLRAGERYEVRLEYLDTSPAARIELHWASRRQARQTIPQNRLFASDVDSTPPTAPTNLRATYVSDRAFRWTWRPSTDDSETVVYATYIGRTKLGATDQPNYVRAGRTPDTSYSFSVRAIDFAGNIVYSGPITVSTLPALPDGDGRGLAAMYFSGADFNEYRLTQVDPKLDFRWNGSPIGDGNDFSARWEGKLLAKYDEAYTFTLASDSAVKLWLGGRLLIDGSTQGGDARHVATQKLRAGKYYNLRIDYQHEFSAAATLRASWSSLSTGSQLIPASQLFPKFVDAAAPLAPGNVRLTGTTESSISFRWDRAHDDVRVARYEIYRHGNRIGSTTETSYTDSGLAASTTYSFTVVAVDGRGRSSPPSDPLSARTHVNERDAFASSDATTFDAASGVTIVGDAIGFLDDGDWVRFNRMNFGSGALSVRFRLAVPASLAGGRIEMRLDGVNGQLIGTHFVQATGSYETYYAQRTAVDPVSGVHDLYLVFKDRSGVANLRSVQFTTRRLLRVMPLGDSITSSTPAFSSYRYHLWQRLISEGHEVDFVGSQTRNAGGTPPNLDFDQNHEGHTGWRADQVLAQVQNWIAAAEPDVVLLHVGTNDIWGGQSVSSTLTDIRQIIGAIRNVNPSITILLAKIIPLTGFSNQIAELNAGIALLADEENQNDSPIVLVDQHSGFNPAQDMYDIAHPNNSGEQKLALRWFEALQQIL